MQPPARDSGRIRLLARKEKAGVSKADLVVKGQGTVSVLLPASSTPVTIGFAPAGREVPSLGIDIDRDKVSLWYVDGGRRYELATKAQPGIGLNPENENLPYWLSLDSNNGRVRYGKGEMLRTLMLFEYSWEKTTLAALAEKGSGPLAFTKDLARVQVLPAEVIALELLPVPVNLDPSPFIVPSDAVTMESLSLNADSVIADLPAACQQLYATVAGRGMTITPPDFPDFPQAIQRSILTPGCICYQKLAEKDPQFGYLRVTIDGNLGDSPGQPYVLEIWPAGNGSPIHNHGRACAIIKVLHGQIQVSLFAALSPALQVPWKQVTFAAGDVTFLSPDYYQIHQLFNPLPKGEDFCATIQSYRYPDSDHAHYEYFDYIDGSTIQQFTPDSDWEYLEFKRLIRQEWDARPH
jgi:hypothetical protein